MPTYSSSNIPAPSSPEEFEKITLSAAKLRWDSINFFLHGRSGQKQQGVDIYGQDTKGGYIGLQCKNTSQNIKLATIKGEIKKAEKFTSKLSEFYIATTAPRDAKIQENVRKISDEREKLGDFSVYILFWDDICSDLTKNNDVLFHHYPQLRPNKDSRKEQDLALLDKFKTLFNSEVMEFLRTHDMHFPFKRSILDNIMEFQSWKNNVEYEFNTTNLEVLKNKLLDEVYEYINTTGTETFSTGVDGKLQSPYTEFNIINPDKIDRIVNNLNSSAQKIVDLHAELIRAGRAL